MRRPAAELYAKALPSYRLRRPADDHAAVIRATQDNLAALTAMYGRLDYSPVIAIAKRALLDAGLPVSDDSPSLPSLHRLTMAASIELHKGALAHLRGKDNYPPENPALRMDTEEAPAAPGRTVADLADAYKAAKWDSWSRSVQIGTVPVFRLIRDALPGRLASSITDADAERVVSLLKELPANIGKRAALKGLTVPEAVNVERKLGLASTKPKTANDGYMVHLTAMFASAVKRKWTGENPFTGLTIADPVEDEDRRDPFKPSDLSTIFGAAPWAPKNIAPAGKPSRYWVPLIAWLTGTRIGEIAGLRLEDVEEREGVSVFLPPVRPSRRKRAAA